MTQKLDTIVLASGSPRRLELLRSLGLEVDVIRSGYDEPDDPEAAPRELARRHARAKLDAVLPRVPGAVVVAADTVVDVDGSAFGKPHDVADAMRTLRLLSGRTHQVHTAYALSAPSRLPFEETTSTAVTFYELSDEEIAEYVGSGEPFDKAGAYGIQGLASALVSSIDGDYFSVMGFPLGRFVRALRRLGFALPSAK